MVWGNLFLPIFKYWAIQEFWQQVEILLHLRQWCLVHREHKGTIHVAGACRLNEVNKMIEPFSKRICLNPTTWMASWNWACWCSIQKLLFPILLGNMINGGIYIPVAFIQATTVIRFPFSADVKEAICFLCLMRTTLLCLCTFVIPVTSTLNILWALWLTYLSLDSKMSKNRAMFSDVKHFTQAAEMPSVVIDSTGCLFKKD